MAQENSFSERDIGRIQQQLEDIIRTNGTTDNTLSQLFAKLEQYGKSITLIEAKVKEADRRLTENHEEIDSNAEKLINEREQRIKDINKETYARSTFEEGIKGSARTTKWVVIIITLICLVASAISAVVTLAR